MKNEFALAFNEVLDEKQLPRDVIIEAIEAAMISAYRKAVNASNAQHVVAKIDADSGKVRIFAEKEVVDDVHDERTEVLLEEAAKVDPEAEYGSVVVVESTPRRFGRVAAQTARQVIQQRMREAERDAQFEYYGKQVGEVVNGIVQAFSASQITLGLEKKAEGIMPRKEQIGRERFRVHDRVRALLLEVKQSPRGPQIILSRAHRNFLRRLLEDEVPEIYQGLVEVRSIAREPGQRSKVSVSALQPGIDPVGACVGVRGVRIQAIVRELNDEKIDVIEWNPEPTEYIAKALSPARVLGVYLDKFSKGAKTATVVVPEDQLSLAIGRDGQNARLAAKLTTWRIDIKSLPEAAQDAMYKLEHDESLVKMIEDNVEWMQKVEIILTRKREGRPITPEDYQVLNRFVKQVETTAIEQRETAKMAERAHRETIRSAIPDIAFDIPIDELGISPRFCILLSGEGFPTIGDLLYQIALDSDAILAINGVGPKAMQEIEEKLLSYEYPVVEEEIAEIAEEEAVAEVAEEVIEDEAALEEEEPDAAPEPEPEVVKEETPVVEEVSFADMLADSDLSTEEMEELRGDASKKKKRKRYVEIEYDPDHDVTLVRRKRKRGGQQDWMDDVDDDWITE